MDPSLLIVRLRSFDVWRNEMSLVDLIFSRFLLISSPNKLCVIWLFFCTSMSVRSFLFCRDKESKATRLLVLKLVASDLLRIDFGTYVFISEETKFESLKIFWYFWRFCSWGLDDSYELCVFWTESILVLGRVKSKLDTFLNWSVCNFSQFSTIIWNPILVKS